MTRLLALVALLAVGLIAGCGDTKSKNDYVDSVNKAQNDFVASINKMNSSGGANGATDTFTQLDTAIGKVVTDLKAVDPPGDVKSLHSQLVSELGKFRTSVKSAGDAIATKDPQKIAKAQGTFGTEASKTAAEIGNTISQINKKLQE